MGIALFQRPNARRARRRRVSAGRHLRALSAGRRRRQPAHTNVTCAASNVLPGAALRSRSRPTTRRAAWQLERLVRGRRDERRSVQHLTGLVLSPRTPGLTDHLRTADLGAPFGSASPGTRFECTYRPLAPLGPFV